MTNLLKKSKNEIKQIAINRRIDYLKRIAKNNKKFNCMYNNCMEKSINAHTISKKASLIHIAEKIS